MSFETGMVLVYKGRGLVRVEGTETKNGEPMLVLKDDFGTKIFFPTKNAASVLRTVVSREEAERRLAVLHETASEPDDRPTSVRHPSLMRTLVKGTDDERVRALQQIYTSAYRPSYADRRMIDAYERAVVEEIAHVLSRPRTELVKELHEVHARTGTFAATGKDRPPEVPAPRPMSPVDVPGHEFLGAFTVGQQGLVAGDPIYVHSSADEPKKAGHRGNVLIPNAAAGEWLAFVRRDREDSGRVAALLAVQRSHALHVDALRKQTSKVADLWVDGGRMAILDASVRDDERYGDAMQFRTGSEGVIEGRGCLSQSGDGDGIFPASTATANGAAVLVVVEF
jgi:RNA polymerase-interacting CarD/CdnL/TRCF family regulator